MALLTSPSLPPALSVSTLTLSYGDRRAVDDLSFEIEKGAVLALLGPSGSGKSSALRLIAGLERPTSGSVRVDGETVAGDLVFVEPECRRVGMVFQDFALFPHLTISDNIAFGIRRQHKQAVSDEVRSLLDSVGLADRAGSYPHMLSGGERQRVALARALAPRPRILLMDEPFSSLDSRLRDQVREQTMALVRRNGITTVIVTHDPSEALRVADWIGVLSHGRLAQFGTPSEIYSRPCSLQMACTFGTVNTIEVAVEGGEIRTSFGVFRAPQSAPSGPAMLCIRPQHVSLRREGPGIKGVVTGVTCVGECTEVRLKVEDTDLLARVTDVSGFSVGDDSHVILDPSYMLVFPRQNGLPVRSPLIGVVG